MMYLMELLNQRVVTTKISIDGWDRVRSFSDSHGVRMADVLSLCLLYMPEEKLDELIVQMKDAMAVLPAPVRNILRSSDKLTPEHRALLLKALDQKD